MSGAVLLGVEGGEGWQRGEGARQSEVASCMLLSGASTPLSSPLPCPLLSSPLLLSPSLVLLPRPTGCPLPQALCISVGVCRDRERESAGGARGRGAGERGREDEGGAREGRWGRGESGPYRVCLPPSEMSNTCIHTHTHNTLTHTHTANTLTMAAPTREEVIRTSTGEGTHRCSPASPRKSAEKQPSSLRIQPSSKDIVVEDASAQVSMKSAANCETSCDPQDLVNHRILERLTLRG